MELIKNNNLNTLEYLIKIIEIKASMNTGLSAVLANEFPNIKPVERLLIVDQIINDPDWLAGFTTAEGCFFVNVQNSSSVKIGKRVHLKFSIGQHSRDIKLMESLINFFKCGKLYLHSNKDVV